MSYAHEVIGSEFAVSAAALEGLRIYKEKAVEALLNHLTTHLLKHGVSTVRQDHIKGKVVARIQDIDSLLNDKFSYYNSRVAERGNLLRNLYKTKFEGHASRKGKEFLEDTARLVGHTQTEIADKFYLIFCNFTKAIRLDVEEYLDDSSPKVEAAFHGQVRKRTEEVQRLFPESVDACDAELVKLDAQIQEGAWGLEGWDELVTIANDGGMAYKNEYLLRGATKP
ncbi:uncharacterized protein LOC62_07G009450 [Vanrija pseudolonga]|uniref:Uncharacterized protein n=1 Tax=Vanrija pseudolonga TaxID=143232 RepID=A0AAF1BLJ5_9TREE|nr:hypothetical protein LOC62_07G009450 [Vanrija pseudolonga]